MGAAVSTDAVPEGFQVLLLEVLGALVPVQALAARADVAAASERAVDLSAL